MAAIVGVIGGGPIGVEMAVSAVRKGFSVKLFERGAYVAQNMRSWGHVKLFSNNTLNVSEDGRHALESAGRYGAINAEDYLTGEEYVQQYLEPLLEYLRASSLCEVCCGSEVTSVGRGGIGKGKSIGGGDRLSTPFRLLVRDTGTGAERFVEGIDVLVDASGTYGNHKWLGKGGIPALGE
jgi:NADPH-dependent 2,4-dienoyl-CoA reductase/sulfur reductase-like enzyme